ncbi:MAG: TMEM175 family protein [Chitinophagales bacterium]
MSELNFNYDKKRFEAFFDAILAIILTILVLELRVPEREGDPALSTKQQVVHLLPSFISYIGSFLLIFGIWIDHHLLFLNIKKITRKYILLNMLFVLSISLIPFSTAFAGNHHTDPFAVALLFVNYVVMNILFSFLFLFAKNWDLLPPSFVEETKDTGRYAYIGILGMVAAIPLAYVNTGISFALGILIFAGHLFKRR